MSKNFTFVSLYSKALSPVYSQVTELLLFIDSKFCRVYECSGGVVVNGNTAMATFTSDDPGATFKCKLNGKRIRRCKLLLSKTFKTFMVIIIFSGTSPLELEELSPGSYTLDITPTCARKAKGKKQTITFTIA